MILITHSLAEGTRMQSLLSSPGDLPDVLREHFVLWGEGQWSMPGTLHMPADRTRLYGIAAELKAECDFNYWVRIDIEPWCEPEDAAERAVFVRPKEKHYRISDLQPLDLVLIGHIWYRIARVKQRSLVIYWGEHRLAIHSAVPQDVREARRPRQRDRQRPHLSQAGTTLGQLRAMLAEEPVSGNLPLALQLRPDGSLAYPLATGVRLGHFAVEEADIAPVIGHLSDDAADGIAAVGLDIERDAGQGPITTATDLLAVLNGLDDNSLVTVPRNGHHGSRLVTPLCRTAEVAHWKPHGHLGHGTLTTRRVKEPGVLALQPIW